MLRAPSTPQHVEFRPPTSKPRETGLQSSPLLELHRAAGATLAAQDALVLSFADVPDEYRAAREDAVQFDQTDRGCIEVHGADAALFLHRLTSNEVRKLTPGQGARNLLLSAKGKVLFDFDLSVLEPDRLELSTSPGRAPALVAALDMYLFSEKVAFRDVTDQRAPISLCGPKHRALIESVLGVAPPSREHEWTRATFEGSEVRVSALPIAGSSGARVDGGPVIAPKLWAAFKAAGAAPAGRIVWDILRVEACSADPTVDFDDSIYPQEARLERAFSLDKGCYIGQEVVAKIDTYGGLNKRLVALALDHDDPIPRGARLSREEDGEHRDLGVCTSWAYSFVLDKGLVLAYVKRRHQAVGTEFLVGDPQQPLGRARIVTSPVRPDALPLTGEFE